MVYKNFETFEGAFEIIKESPSNRGSVQLIVIRPEEDKREELAEGQLDVDQGLIGDNWATRGSSKTEDGSAHPDMQVNIMNSRVIRLLTQDKSDWKMAGDQLYIDFDLSKENVPPGTRLSVGEAELEVTPMPHTGCKKFAQRFGRDALKFISTEEGRQWQLRGINARVVKSGTVKLGDLVVKLNHEDGNSR